MEPRPTEKQIKRIAKLGGTLNARATSDEAKRLISELEGQLPATPHQIQRLIKAGGVPRHGMTRAEAGQLFAELLGNQPASEFDLRALVDAGGIPFNGITTDTARRLAVEFRKSTSAECEEIKKKYGDIPAHPYMLQWLESFGYILADGVTSAEAAEAIQTTNDEVAYLGFQNTSLFGDDENSKNSVAQRMRRLRKASFPEWAHHKRELIVKHSRLLAARESADSPAKERIEAIKLELISQSGELCGGWWNHQLKGEDSYLARKLHYLDQERAGLTAIRKTLEWERVVFWLAFTGVNMCPHETDWMLGYDFGDLPDLAAKLAKKLPPMTPAAETEVAAVLSKLDAEQRDWELHEPERCFVNTWRILQANPQFQHRGPAIPKFQTRMQLPRDVRQSEDGNQ